MRRSCNCPRTNGSQLHAGIASWRRRASPATRRSHVAVRASVTASAPRNDLRGRPGCARRREQHACAAGVLLGTPARRPPPVSATREHRRARNAHTGRACDMRDRPARVMLAHCQLQRHREQLRPSARSGLEQPVASSLAAVRSLRLADRLARIDLRCHALRVEHHAPTRAGTTRSSPSGEQPRRVQQTPASIGHHRHSSPARMASNGRGRSSRQVPVAYAGVTIYVEPARVRVRVARRRDCRRVDTHNVQLVDLDGQSGVAKMAQPGW